MMNRLRKNASLKTVARFSLRVAMRRRKEWLNWNALKNGTTSNVDRQFYGDKADLAWERYRDYAELAWHVCRLAGIEWPDGLIEPS